MKGIQLSRGSILLAEPFMVDPNFKRSVVMICEVNQEDGAIGFILNKSIKTNINQVVEDFPNFEADVYFGGPVQTDTLHYFHTLGNVIDDSQEIVPGVFWGGNFETVKLLIETGQAAPRDFRFYIGYSGWGVGQLESEMKENSWIVTAGDLSHVMNTAPQNLWKDILTEMGGKFKVMSSYPEHPSLN